MVERPGALLHSPVGVHVHSLPLRVSSIQCNTFCVSRIRFQDSEFNSIQNLVFSRQGFSASTCWGCWAEALLVQGLELRAGSLVERPGALLHSLVGVHAPSAVLRVSLLPHLTEFPIALRRSTLDFCLGGQRPVFRI